MTSDLIWSGDEAGCDIYHFGARGLRGLCALVCDSVLDPENSTSQVGTDSSAWVLT